MQTLEAPPQDPKVYDVQKELAALQETARKRLEAVTVTVSDAGNLVQLSIKTAAQAHSLTLSPAQALDLAKALKAAGNKIGRAKFEQAVREKREQKAKAKARLG